MDPIAKAVAQRIHILHSRGYSATDIQRLMLEEGHDLQLGFVARVLRRIRLAA